MTASQSSLSKHKPGKYYSITNFVDKWGQGLSKLALKCGMMEDYGDSLPLLYLWQPVAPPTIFHLSVLARNKYRDMSHGSHMMVMRRVRIETRERERMKEERRKK